MNMVNNEYKYINLDYLNLMADDDVDMKKTMLEMLFDEPLDEIERMKEMFQEQNLEAIKAISHKMKSTLAFVGSDVLTSTNKEVENIAKDEGGLDKLPSLLEVLSDNYKLAVIELKKEYARL